MNKSTRIVLTTLAFSLSAAVAMPKDVSIPFADHGGIRDWEANRDIGIWVQDTHRRWYYAKFLGPCHELRFAEGVGFVTGPGGTLDKFSSLRVRGGERCVFTTFDASTGPPLKQRKAKPAPAVTAESPQTTTSQEPAPVK